MKNHIFEIPKEYEYETEPGIELTTRYYYTKSGRVKLIDYTWSETSEPNNRKFKMLFSKLERKISEDLGENSFRNIESEKIEKNDLDTYRDDVKWTTSTLNAYMYRFGDNENRHNEINLFIYFD